MYLEHFGLTKFPFRITPDPAFLYWTVDHRRAFDHLNHAARGDRTIDTILGEPGTGKTMLLQHFVARLPRDVRVGVISNYSSGLGGLSHWLSWAFGLRPKASEEDSRANLEAHLIAWHHQGARCLLIVDEAQNVSDDDLAALTELTRLPTLSGLTMRLVLAGQPRLRHRLHCSPGRGDGGDAAPLQLGSMSPHDVAGYVRHRMSTAGCPDPVFNEESLVRIARLSAGVPRLVNVLCEQLLTSAFGAKERKIDATFLDRVLQEGWQSGMLDHLFTPPALTASKAATPTPVHAPLPAPPASSPPAASITLPLPARNAKPTTLPTETEVRPTPVEPSAKADAPLDIPPAPAAANQPRSQRAILGYIAAGTAAATLALVVIAPRFIAQPPTVVALQQEHPPLAHAIEDSAAVPFDVGPALPAPANLSGTDASTLQDQALLVGEHDPLTAAIGFSRAALRGDARAAYYLGQHFEVGDGVPRSTQLAAAWYASASETQRSARRALQNLTETAGATGQTSTAPPRPLMGIVGADQLAEFVWAAPDDAAARYLVELAQGPDAPPLQYGPFDLSAALLDPAGPVRIWRVVSLSPEGTRISASAWHLIAAGDAEAQYATPGSIEP